jgi:cytochrome c-type biogenesis protein CcmI
MPEALLLLLGLAVAGAFVLAPLWRSGAAPAPTDDREAAELRHRVALEALRDVEADRRAGSLDDAAYAQQLADAEARAAATSAAARSTAAATPTPAPPAGRSRAVAFVAAGGIAAALLIGAAVPGTGVGNATVVNETLAAAQRSEAARQEEIGRLLDRVAAEPTDTEALSDLADAYLAGSAEEDLVRGAVALRLLIDLEPQRADAYERIVTAYIRAGDYANARAALTAYEALDAGDPAEVAFFDGLIALRGEDDPAAAVEAFDRFLRLAPDDGRAGMVRELRDEAAGE